MKMSTLILASLMTLTSAAAFAEGGAERSKEFYNNFSFIQEKPTARLNSKLPAPMANRLSLRRLIRRNRTAELILT